MIKKNNVIKISSDFILNIAASIILVATLQLFVYPKIASICDVGEYGIFLTVIGIANTLSATFGNGLNNLRLIMNEEYFKKNICGDFNIFLIFAIFINIIVSLFVCYFFKFSLLEYIIFILTVSLAIVRMYLIVSFRVNLDYSKVLLFNIFMCLSYVFATIYYIVSPLYHKYWLFIFFTTEIMSCLYLYLNTNLLSEPLVKTKLFSIALYRYINLIYLTLLGNILLYMDRNLLFPILGSTTVATFFAATVVGKAMGIITQPVASVLLSYFSQVGFNMTKKKFWSMNFAVCIVGICGYVIAIFISDSVVGYFYPSLYVDSKKYFILANLIPILGVIGSMAQPAVLRYVSLTKQSIIQTIYLLLLVLVCYYGAIEFGLVGFCYATILLSIFRIGILWFLGNRILKN